MTPTPPLNAKLADELEALKRAVDRASDACTPFSSRDAEDALAECFENNFATILAALRTPALPEQGLDARTVEACAKICSRVAINAERRAAGHTNLDAQQAALDKMQAAQECEQAIRALSPSVKEGE